MSTEPSALLARFCSFLPQTGLALDVACGYGQNTRFLARKGLSAIGIDLSWKALAAGREVAARSNLNIAFVRADLTLFALPANTFSVIICFKYRDPDLYPGLRAALKPGGILIYETYTDEHVQFGLRPRDPAHLLERDELLRAFEDWEIIFYREVWVARGMASLVARKPFSSREC
ncbi:MAG: class I SAM-dependent methyltransferase [Acidobacteriota bacterium]